MTSAVYPGTFDPLTLGHMDIIERASHLFDNLTIAILNNVTKQPLFSIEERMDLITTATSSLPNISVATFSGLLVDFVQKEGIHTIVRGVRTVADFEYEYQMANINHQLGLTNETSLEQSGNRIIETIFLPAHQRFTHISASAVREIAYYGGNIDSMVPEVIQEHIYSKFQELGGK